MRFLRVVECQDGVNFLSSGSAMRGKFQEAEAWVCDAISAVRLAPGDSGGPNPWSNASDEAIAGEILRRVNSEAT